MEKQKRWLLVIIILLSSFGLIFLGYYYFPNLSASLFQKEAEVVDKDGFGNSLVVDFQNVPKASYVKVNGKLVLAERFDNVWKKGIIADDAFPASKTSLLIDKNGKTLILYIAKLHYYMEIDAYPNVFQTIP